MKVGKKALRMSSGEIRHFKSETARDNFEDVARAVKHGFVPRKNIKGCFEDKSRAAKPL